MRRILMHLAHRHLVGAPVILQFGLPSTSFGPVQPFGRTQHDHGPARTSRKPFAAHQIGSSDLADDVVQGRGHQLVHLQRVVALDEMRRVAIAPEQLIKFLVADAREDDGLAIL